MQRNRFKLCVSTICLGLFLTGCAVDYSTKSPESIQSEYQTFDSTFDQAKSVIGPAVTGEVDGLYLARYEARLAYSVNKSTGLVLSMLTMHISYMGKNWFHVKGATLSNAKKPITKVGLKDVRCSVYSCSYEEQLTVVLDNADLKHQMPFQIRIDTERGAGLITLPSTYVDAFLALKAQTMDTALAPAFTAPSKQIESSVPATPAVQLARSSNTKSAHSGKHQASARSTALGQACAEQPNPKLMSSAPGSETYTVACDDSSVLVLRCEFGNCRPMQ